MQSNKYDGREMKTHDDMGNENWDTDAFEEWVGNPGDDEDEENLHHKPRTWVFQDVERMSYEKIVVVVVVIDSKVARGCNWRWELQADFYSGIV